MGLAPLQEKKMKKAKVAGKGKKLAKEVEMGGGAAHRESLCSVVLGFK